jgi:hypothetical protein
VPDSAGDELRGFLKQQAEAAAEEAVRVGADLPSERVERHQRLQRVLEAYDATHPRPARRRWPAIAVFIATLLVCSTLMFLRRGVTDIDLDVTVEEVTFVLPSQQKLTELAALTILGGSGMRAVELPRPRGLASDLPQPTEGETTAARLSTLSDSKRPGSITLETIILPATARVRLRTDAATQMLRLALQRADVELKASAYGAIEVAGADQPIPRVELGSPQPVVFKPGPGEAALDLKLVASGGNLFATPLRADSLSFMRVDEAVDETRTVVRQSSAILSGSLYFESLNGLQRNLRVGEMLQLSGATGEIRGLRVEPDHIALRYHGRVEGLTVGAGESRRSLMPTWLDWLKARHGLWLLWGTAVYVFGLVMGALKWLGKNP